jgi:hypothetical protein
MAALLSPALVALSGMGIGAACGFTTRRARLCSYGALEAALLGGDWRLMRGLGLALAVALALTQIQIAAGWFSGADTAFLPDRVTVVATLLGSALFGLGMALVGTCAYGSLVRLGAGDMRGFVVILVYAAVGYATLRGVLAPARLAAERLALEMPAGVAPSLFDALGDAVGRDLRFPAAAACVAALVALALADARLRASPRLLVAAVTLGLSVAAGWAITANADDFETGRRITSLTFVAPVARAVFGGLLDPGLWIDFGVGSVFGVPLGAFLAARAANEFRWEAFDDPREMRRHLLGACLMGFGGLLAGGCTIGQGLTAGSLGAFTWPLALLGMATGARLGMSILVEGRLHDVLSAWLARRRARD